MYLILKNHEYGLEYISNIQEISNITCLDTDLIYCIDFINKGK